MGVLGQTLLLLWKNLILRVRYPGVLVLEILWPILIVGIVAIMRLGVPPFRVGNCHYQARALPSAGLVPFLQTYICNLDNHCYATPNHLEYVDYTANSFSKMTQDLGPYFSSPEVLDVLAVSNKSATVFMTMKNVLGDKKLIDDLEEAMYFRTYFRNPDEVKRILVSRFQFSQQSANAFMDSKLNVRELLNIAGMPAFRIVACDPEKLGSYIKVSNQSDIALVSASLCGIEETKLPDLVNQVLRQVNVTAIINSLKLVEGLKANMGAESLETILDSVADMFELVMSSDSLIPVLVNFAGTPDITDLIRQIPSWVNGFTDLSTSLASIQGVVDSLEPLMKTVGANDSPIWLTVKSVAELGLNIIKLGSGEWNGTSEEFLKPVGDLMSHLENLIKTGEGQQMIVVLDFISKINWPNIYDQLVYTDNLDDQTVIHLLDSLEEMLRQFPDYDVVQKISRLAQHSLDVVSILIDMSTDLRTSLKRTVESSEGFASKLNQILMRGPEVTKALLDTFTQPQVLSELMVNASSYVSVCHRVMEDVKPRLPLDVYIDVRDTLCVGDIADEMTVILNQLGLHDIGNVINSTAETIMGLYDGDFYGKTVKLASLHGHVNRLLKALENYDVMKWSEIFENMQSIDFSDQGWESVSDMLTTDYLTRGILGAYRGLGTVLVGTPVSNEIAPYIYAMSQFTKSGYQMMQTMTTTYSADSSITKLIGLITSYLPELATGLNDMWKNNMDMIYQLASSSDPLGTFCGNNYLGRMNMPAYVPLMEMNTTICETNWPVAIQDLTQSSMAMQTMIEEMIRIFESPDPSLYDVEMDWIDMMDYTERIMDMLSSGDLENADFTMGYQTLIDNLNFTTLFQGLEIFMGAEVTMEDLEKVAEISYRVMENLEKTQGDQSEWQNVKTALFVFDGFLDYQIQILQVMQNTDSIENLLKTYPPSVRTMTNLLAKAYPELVRHLPNLILKPEMLLDKIIRDGFQEPDCHTYLLSDYLLLPPTSYVHQLERYICSLDTDQLLNNFTTSQPEAGIFIDRVFVVSYNTSLNIVINWQELTSKTIRLLELLESSTIPETFDLTPFNMTQIDLSWQEFYRAAETLQNYDMNKITELSTRIQYLFTQMIGLSGDDSMLTMALNANQFISYHFLKFTNTILTDFNSSPVIVLTEYLRMDNSTELAKIKDLLMSSPDFNAVGVATLQRILTRPDKAVFDMDLGVLCVNITQFSEAFVVQASSLDPAILQQAICELRFIDINVLLEELATHLNGLEAFLIAMDDLSRARTSADLTVDPADLIVEYDLLNKNLEKLVTNLPTFILDRDNKLTDMSVYAAEWDKLDNSLQQLGANLENMTFFYNWQSSVTMLVYSTMEKIPELRQTLVFIEVAVDLMQKQLDQMTGASLAGMRQYYNTNIVLNLLSQAPEMLQTVMYTVLTHQEKLERWPQALESWPSFCGTPADLIFTVPPGLAFSMAQFKSEMCKVDPEAFLQELNEYQGTNRLMLLFENGTLPAVSSAEVQVKFDKLLKSYTDYIMNQPVSVPVDPFSRLLNTTLWDEVGARISVWSSQSMDFSPQGISGIVSNLLTSLAPDVASTILPVYDKAIAVTNIVLDQLMEILDSQTLAEAFKESPSLQLLAGLLDELPELLETLIYTNNFAPQKLSTQLTQVMSFESFCAINPDDLFESPPNSVPKWDYQAWMARLCSLNISSFMEEIDDIAFTRKLSSILNETYMGLDNITEVVHKAEDLFSKLESGLGMSNRLFDPAVWAPVEKQLTSWSTLFDSPLGFLQSQFLNPQLLFQSLSGVPGMTDIFRYMDAVIDMMITGMAQLDGSLADAFKDYRTLSVILDLLREAPEMIETVLYTTWRQPEKVTKWALAMESFPTFCSTPVDQIMSVPSGLQFNVSAYIAKLCTIDPDELMLELSQYQGVDRLTRILMGNDTSTVNVTALQLKYERLINMSMNIFESPINMDLSDLRILNESIWDEVAGRMDGWFNDSLTELMSVGGVASIFEGLFGAYTPEVKDVYDRLVAAVDVLVDEVLGILRDSSFQEAWDGVPSLQKILRIANYLPEFYETLVYTNLYYPEKITARLDVLRSLESFCLAPPQDLFEVPPDSNFKLDQWLMEICTLNITAVEEEMALYRTNKVFRDIISGYPAPPPDVPSLVVKIDRLLTHLEKGIQLNDRLFNESIWTYVNNRVGSWLSTSDLVNDPAAFLSKQQMLWAQGSILYLIRTNNTEALHYVDAVLDIIDGYTTDLQGGISNDLPTLRTILSLVEQAPEMIETAMYTIITQQLKTARWSTALQSLDAFCNTPVESIMSVPPNSQFDVEDYIQRLCSVDLDKLVMEINDNQGFDRIAQIMEGNGTSSLNITALLLKADDVFRSLDVYFQDPMTAVGFDLRVFNESVWEGIGQRIEEWTNQPMDLETLLPQIIKGGLEQLFGSLAMDPQMKPYLDQAVAISSVLLDEIAMILQASSLEEAFQNVPSLRKLLDLANSVPELYEAFAYTSVFAPQKWSLRASSLTSLEAFCKTKPEDILSLPPNSTFDLNNWWTKFCALNLTEVEMELASYRTSRDIQQILTGSSSVPPNITSLVDKLDSLIQRLTSQGVMFSDRVLNSTVWAHVYDRLRVWITDFSADDSLIMSPTPILSSMNDLIESNPGLKDALKPLGLLAAVFDEMLDVALRLENRTEFGAADIVEGWSNMQKLLDLIQMPGFIDVLSVSASEFSALFTDMANIQDFCSPGTPASKYLKAPPGKSVDLSKLQVAFCSINFTAFMDDFDAFFNTQNLDSIANGAEDFDWSQLSVKLIRVNSMVDRWVKNPPQFLLPPDWQRTTYWEQLLETVLQQTEDMSSLRNQIESIIKQLQPILAMDGFRETGLVLNSILDILNENILSMQNATYTLGNAVKKIPALKDLFYSLGLDSSFLEAVLMAPIKNATLVAEMFLSEDFMTEFCVTNKWNEFLDLPANFDTTSLYSAICSGNADVLLSNLTNTFNLNSMVAALRDSKAHADWDQVADKILTLIDNLEALMKNPPVFTSDATLDAVISSYSDTDRLWKMLSALSALESGMDPALEGTVGGIFRIGDALLNYLNQLMARLQLQNGRLDLAALFKDVPEVVAIIDGFLSLEPDPITGLLAVQLDASKAQQWIAATTDPSRLTKLFCDESEFRKLFKVKPGFNVTELLNSLCGMNFDTVAEKLASSFNIMDLEEKLMNSFNSTSPFNSEEFMRNIDSLISKIENLTQVDYIMFGDHDLENVLMVNESRLMELLTDDCTADCLLDSFTKNYLSITTSILNDVLRGMSNVTEVKTLNFALRFIRLYLQNFNAFLTSIEGQPINLAVLLNNTEVGKIIKPILADPNILNKILSAEVDVKELSRVMRTSNPVDVLCGDGLWSVVKVAVSERQSLQELQSQTCTSNQTELLWQSIMLQANGYEIYRQMEVIQKELEEGRSSLDSLATGQEMEKFVNLLTTIINQYLDGSRSIEDLLDLKSFQDSLSRAETQLARTLMDQAAKWSLDITDILLPSVLDQGTYQNVAKTINSANVLMDVAIEHLKAIQSGSISVSTLLNNADGLAQLIEAYMRMGKNIAQAWLNNEIDLAKLIGLFQDMDRTGVLCGQPGGVAAELTGQPTPSNTVKDVSTVICSTVTDTVMSEIENFVDYDKLRAQLTEIWSNSSITPDITGFSQNVQEFASVVEAIANSSLAVSSKLQDLFDFSQTLNYLEDIATNPAQIFRLLQLAGLALEGPLQQEPEAMEIMSALNTFAVMPIVDILEALKANGMTLETIVQDPESLLNLASTLLDFDLHYSVIETVYLSSQVKRLEANIGDICRNVISTEPVHSNSNLTVGDVFCSLQPSKWLPKLKEAGLSQAEIILLFEKISSLNGRSSSDPMPDQSVGWVELMANLERLTSLLTLKKVDQSSLTYVRTTWDAVKDILFDKTLESGLSYLQVAEAMTAPSDDWIRFKQFLRFTSSSLDFISNNIDHINKNASVRLSDVLPDSNRVSSLINNVFGTSNSAEVLTASINPALFYQFSLTDSWDLICKGNSLLSTYFSFPQGTDVTRIQEHLCQAVEQRSSSFLEFLSLFRAGDVLLQLDMLLNSQFNESSRVSVWEAFHSSVLRLIDMGEQLQYAQMDEGSVMTWLTPVLNTLTSLQSAESSQVVTLCNSMILYMNNTQTFLEARPLLARIITATKLLTDLVHLVPEMDELVCALMSGNKIDIIAAANYLDSLGIFDSITEFVEEFVNPPSTLDCSAPLETSTSLTWLVNLTATGQGLDVNKLMQCTDHSEAKFRHLLSSFSESMDLIKDLVTVMQMPALRKLLNGPDMAPFFEFIFDSVQESNNHMLLYLRQLFSDPTQAADYLRDKLGFSQDMVDAFVNATVNSNWAYLFDQPTQTLVGLMCSPDQLSSVLQLPKYASVNISEVSQLLCTSDIIDTVEFMKNVSHSNSDIAELLSKNSKDVAELIKRLTMEVVTMIDSFQDIIQLTSTVFSGLDIDSLTQNLDVVDKIIENNDFVRLAQSLRNILDDIRQLVPQGIGYTIVNDIERIIDGIMGLDILQNAFLNEIKIKDLVKDPDYLKNYLSNSVGLDETDVDAIMDGRFKLKLLTEVEDMKAYTCDEVVDKLVILNSTEATLREIRASFCSLSDDQLVNLLKALTPYLDIGDLVTKYVHHMDTAFFESTNITKSELDDMVEKIDRGQVVLRTASDIIMSAPNGSSVLNAFSVGSTSALVSLENLTPAMCGRQVDDIFDMDYDPGVIVSTSEDLEQGMEGDINDDIDDLPNEFCVQMYNTIRQSSIGSILWTYLKPVLRGKILYTPDNAATRAIIAEANTTFKDMAEVYRVAKLWAEETPNLMAMVDAAAGATELKEALENEFVQGLLESTVGVSADALISGVEALQVDNFDQSQLKSLQSAAEVIANYSSCISLSRFEPVASEKELEVEAFRLSKSKTFLAGVVFIMNDDDNDGNSTRRKRQASGEIPKHITYKIRMDVDNVMDTNSLKSKIWKMSAEDNFIEDLRYLRGFMHVQDMLDTAIINAHKNQAYRTPGIRLKQIPFPCHHLDNFIFLLGSYLIPVMMTFVFLGTLGTATHNLVYDRENGQEETLKVMGMMSGVNFLAWLLTTLFIMAVVNVILSIMLYYLDIFIYSNPVFVFVYLMEFCLSSVMLLYMVSSFFNRTTMAILFVLMIYLISYLPYILVIGLGVTMEFWQKVLACLASTTAFSFGSMTLAYLEESGSGVQWDNIDQDVMRDFNMSFAMVMMLIDSAIYFLVGWYVRNVKPGKFGVSWPWYFPVMPTYWSSCFRSKGSGDSSNEATAETLGSLFEPTPQDFSVGIALHGISKSYGGKKKALKNLNINIYRGQITSLLGHNGAAKTTTLKIICGVMEPSSGRVVVDGSEPGCCKQTLGVCPQQNALFAYMTVMQHMMFYAEMKGSNKKSWKTKDEIERLLKDVHMWVNRNTPVRDLSYGMKRRLCVALAFVGGSQTVVLDEPTSGVDPHTRKNIWNLITRNREDRTILLSTHHLDEADILSDRIAVMHTGKLLCYGSPAFLKRSLGGGFKLTVVKKESDNFEIAAAENSSVSKSEAITRYIQSLSPGAKLVEQIGLEMTFNLPKDEQSMTVSFYQFFRQLDECQQSLGISNYGLSDTTLEEVFLELTLKADDADEPGIVNPVMTSKDRTTALDAQDLRMETNKEFPKDKVLFGPALRIGHSGPHRNKMGFILEDEQASSTDLKTRSTGASLTMLQAKALFLKRFHHYRRNWRLFLTCLLLPLLGFLIAIAFSTIRPDENELEALVLDPAIYGPKIYNFFQDKAHSPESERYVTTLTDKNFGVGTTCLMEAAEKYLEQYDQCVAGTPWYNNTMEVYWEVCQNARQVYSSLGTYLSVPEKVIPSDQYLQDLKLEIEPYIMYTFKDYKDKRFGGWTFEQSASPGTPTVDPYVWFNSKGYHTMPSYFNSMSNIVLRALLPSGKKPKEYGITAINHPMRFGRPALTMKSLQTDAADAGIAVLVVVAFSFIPGGFILYLINERTQKQRQLQNISGVGFFCYWIVSFIWDMFVYSIAVGLAVVIVCIFQMDSYYLKDNLAAFAVILLLFGWSIIPCTYCVVRLFSRGSTAYLVTFCCNLFIALISVISLLVMQLFRDSNSVWQAYKVCKYLYLIFPQYCLGQGLMDMVSSMFFYKLFLRFEADRYTSPFSLEVIGWHLIALAIQGAVFFIAAMVIDAITSPALSLNDKLLSKYEMDDADVARERERVLHGSNNDVLVVDSLSKVYRRGFKKFLAVNNISFGVPEGECFGLLGVNGAGKTTTFRMLTGDIRAAGGTAILKGKTISTKDQNFGQDVGYCPQEGGLDDYLTAEEMLHFHARLRGFSPEQSEILVPDLIERLQLTAYTKKAVHTYSGGTKRKLALAVALLGNPQILYLDEPTTGMDAATRRLAWAAILQANQRGQSVVLTSHSMDECDALCSKIAIMVNGNIKCIGSPQHLKHRFGDGYTVIIHVSDPTSHDISNFFQQKFPGSVVKAAHHNSVELRVPQNSAKVADIIALLQSSQRDGVIEYYSLSQTTLDSVFISFAQEQRDSYSGSSSSSASTDGRSDTPHGSISSSSSPPSSDIPKSKELPVFINPQFVPDEPQSQPQPQPHAPQQILYNPQAGNYSSNIIIGSRQNTDAPDHIQTRL
ncbi:uncharacterized protein LOC101860234 [Aplysia californica]|uniref:Uncharacterized protein LOC101860234 n=1 Tax=Aplysia californica TaxID=6500 RepID=A0ABM1W592_APLCA|nr:uncharacterized protein LOC101860234 [Aplysia californica]